MTAFSPLHCSPPVSERSVVFTYVQMIGAKGETPLLFQNDVSSGCRCEGTLRARRQNHRRKMCLLVFQPCLETKLEMKTDFRTILTHEYLFKTKQEVIVYRPSKTVLFSFLMFREDLIDCTGSEEQNKIRNRLN